MGSGSGNGVAPRSCSGVNTTGSSTRASGIALRRGDEAAGDDLIDRTAARSVSSW